MIFTIEMECGQLYRLDENVFFGCSCGNNFMNVFRQLADKNFRLWEELAEHVEENPVDTPELRDLNDEFEHFKDTNPGYTLPHYLSTLRRHICFSVREFAPRIIPLLLEAGATIYMSTLEKKEK